MIIEEFMMRGMKRTYLIVSKNKIVCISDGALNQIKYELFPLEHGKLKMAIANI